MHFIFFLFPEQGFGKLSGIVLKLRPHLDLLIKKRGTTTKKFHRKSLVK